MKRQFTRVLTRAATRRSLRQVRYVTPVSPDHAQGLVARTYAQLNRDFGMIAPPVALHSPAPLVLAASWLMLRETLLATGHVDRATKETVAAAVSLSNACPYCVDVHGTLLSGLASGRDAVAVAEGRFAAVADPRLRDIAEWARSAAGPEGRAPQVRMGAAAAAEVVGVAVVFHYLNRMVNVFLPESPLPIGTGGARGGVLRVVGRLVRRFSGAPRPPGDSLQLLPPAPPAASWAAAVPGVAAAFDRAIAAIESAGRRALPAAVRTLVVERLSGWNGEPPGPSAAWAREAVAGLDPAQRPAGRLALLVAMASFQANASVIGDLRRAEWDDRRLIEATSWASLAAARRAGAVMLSRLPEDRPDELVRGMDHRPSPATGVGASPGGPAEQHEGRQYAQRGGRGSRGESASQAGGQQR